MKPAISVLYLRSAAVTYLVLLTRCWWVIHHVRVYTLCQLPAPSVVTTWV